MQILAKPAKEDEYARQQINFLMDQIETIKKQVQDAINQKGSSCILC